MNDSSSHRCIPVSGMGGHLAAWMVALWEEDS